MVSSSGAQGSNSEMEKIRQILIGSAQGELDRRLSALDEKVRGLSERLAVNETMGPLVAKTQDGLESLRAVVVENSKALRSLLETVQRASAEIDRTQKEVATFGTELAELRREQQQRITDLETDVSGIRLLVQARVSADGLSELLHELADRVRRGVRTVARPLDPPPAAMDLKTLSTTDIAAVASQLEDRRPSADPVAEVTVMDVSETEAL